jgi:hypothetical protein
LFFALLLVAAVVFAAASPTKQPPVASKQRILFVGNSYTYYNNLPAVFEQLGNASRPGSIETKMVVAGGATLKDLWDRGEALRTIQQGGWTYVILQEQSTLGRPRIENGIPQINEPSAFHEYARRFDAEIKKAGAKTVFYMTWSRQDSPQNQAKLTAAYSSIAKELGAILAPVGLAWQEVVGGKPELTLYLSDKSHPSPAGTYLAACVFYATLFKRDPAGLPPRVIGKPFDDSHDDSSSTKESKDVELVSLTAQDARFLQQVAWKSVRTQTEAKSSSLFNDSNTLITHGSYLAALRVIQQPADSEGESTRLQMSSWFLSAVGNYGEAQRSFNDSAAKRRQALQEPTEKELDSVRRIPLLSAEEVVLSAVKGHQVVILNEAHHQPEHRAFGARLMPQLAALGVKFVAIETGDQASLDEIAKTGVVKTTTDVYSWDPQRADLLRAIVRAGLKLIAIDVNPREGAQPQSGEDRIAFRESNMARELQAVVDSEPGAKVLVWVGFSHALKTPQGQRGTEWMAARFWKSAMIEPYSIYQMSDEDNLALDDPIYRLVVTGRPDLKRPMGIRLPIASFAGQIPPQVTQDPLYSSLAKLGADAVIVHPLKTPTSATQRPAWLAAGDTAEIGGRLTCGHARCMGYLVQAVRAEDGDADGMTAPVDQVVTRDDGEYLLRVPSGAYKLRVSTLDAAATKDVLVGSVPAATYRSNQRAHCDIHVSRRA